MEEAIAFIDDGFLAKLSRYFGNGKYLKFDKIKFVEILSKRENLICKHLFYYTAPPFQSPNPSNEENKRREQYDKFIKNLLKSEKVTLREGRCQRLKIDGKFIYKQKAVDSLLIMDMSFLPFKYQEIKNIILIASDSDFVPVIKNLKDAGINVILATYFEKKRHAKFSTTNELIESAGKCVELSREDFDNAVIEKEEKNDKDK